MLAWTALAALLGGWVIGPSLWVIPIALFCGITGGYGAGLYYCWPEFYACPTQRAVTWQENRPPGPPAWLPGVDSADGVPVPPMNTPPNW